MPTDPDSASLLAELRDDDAAERLIAMPIVQRLQVVTELCRDLDGQREDLDSYVLVEAATCSLYRELKDQGRQWAPKTADMLLSLAQSHRRHVPMVYRWPVFWALVKAKVPIEARWDALLPVEWSQAKRTRACVRAIPKERRARAILAALEHTVRPVEIGMSLLPDFWSAELAVGILVLCERTGTPLEQVAAQMRKLGRRRPKVIAAVEAYLSQVPKPVVLVCQQTLRPDSVDVLTPLQLGQLEAAGEAYDGRKLDAAARLAAGDETGSFLGTLEILLLADAVGVPAYDVYLYQVDSGTVFRSGTTQDCAHIVHGSVECDDVALRDGLSVAIEARPRE